MVLQGILGFLLDFFGLPFTPITTSTLRQLFHLQFQSDDDPNFRQRVAPTMAEFFKNSICYAAQA